MSRYLRLSLTDRCNLRCRYCMPNGYRVDPKAALLTLEERVATVGLLVEDFGIEKVRLTGGEPLIYRGLEEVIRRLAALPGLSDLAMTTNAIGLADRAQELRRLGLRRVNISLDTMDRQTFADLCQRDEISEVFAGIEAAIQAGLVPVKVNAVALKGINDTPQAIEPFLDFAWDTGITLRFQELMPIGGVDHMPGSFVSTGAITSLIEEHFGPLKPRGMSIGGTAEEYALAYRGRLLRLGMISPVSRPFCYGCGRYRLTSKGRLVTCLRSQRSVDLMPWIRPFDREALARTLRQSLSAPRHDNRFEGDLAMTEIGG